MANQAFSDTDQQQLQATFEAVEAEFAKAGTHEQYLKLASELAERYGVATALTPETDHVHKCNQ